jgi:NADPH2:quinone reductase
MHAIVVSRTGDASVLEWTERPDPKPGPGEVTIRVTVSGVNFADIMRRRGGYRGGPPPFVPGLDCMGTIIAVAKDILTYPLPDGVPDEAGASLTMLVTAYNLLVMTAKLERGESVLINAAAGGVGSIAIQCARALGAGTIIAVAGGAEKVAFAKSLGADIVVDHTSDDLAAKLEPIGGKVDVILDSVAGDWFNAAIPLLAEFGRYCIYGSASGEPGEVFTNVLHAGSRAVLGYSTGGYRAARPERLRPGVEGAFDLVCEGLVKVIVGGKYPLRDAAEAHRFVESRASHAKVLLTV